MACNEFSRCVVNTLTSEPECLCDPGYSTVDGNPCTSICDLQPEYCLNGGQCEIKHGAGHGAACRYVNIKKNCNIVYAAKSIYFYRDYKDVRKTQNHLSIQPEVLHLHCQEKSV